MQQTIKITQHSTTHTHSTQSGEDCKKNVMLAAVNANGLQPHVVIGPNRLVFELPKLNDGPVRKSVISWLLYMAPGLRGADLLSSFRDPKEIPGRRDGRGQYISALTVAHSSISGLRWSRLNEMPTRESFPVLYTPSTLYTAPGDGVLSPRPFRAQTPNVTPGFARVAEETACARFTS